MRGAISSQRGAQSKHMDNFTFTFTGWTTGVGFPVGSGYSSSSPRPDPP
jgi:hypothetical protein